MTTGEHRSQRGYHAAAHAAHRLILEQHTELRRLLALGLVQTCMPPHRRQPVRAELKVLVGQIRAVFLQHLADEEAVLPPLFGADPASAQATLTWREQHARQRQELEALRGLSEAESAALADRFDGLARALLIDIAEEERALALALAVLDQRAAPDEETPRKSCAPRSLPAQNLHAVRRRLRPIARATAPRR
jgi:hypothetical protein